MLCMRHSGAIAGVVNVNAIVRGFFQSAYLGYYIGEPFARQGIMSEGLKLVIGYAFGPMKLHRLEANVQPGNVASIALVRRCGFRKEGFSPRYLQVMGEWRDHERWAYWRMSMRLWAPRSASFRQSASRIPQGRGGWRS